MTKESLLKNTKAYFPNEDVSYPIANEIVKILVEKKISYAEACEALDIAKEGLGTMIISVNPAVI